jgi:hypothetical protein
MECITQCDTEPDITVYTEVKCPRGLFLRKTYVTYSRATLGRPVILSKSGESFVKVADHGLK